jgi:uncharacterized protein (TIGR02646 family)
MILVVRGTEPAGLTAARGNRLAAAVAAFNAHGAPSDQLKATLIGYSLASVKNTLYARQHRKCAYCERRTDYSSHPVEHFRPKDGAHRHERAQAEVVDEGHYWWLSWSWENLLFSCVRCNDQGHKGNFFQVAAGTACTCPTSPIAAPHPDPVVSVATESSMFIDPAGAADPMTLLWWEPQTHTPLGLPVPPRLWTWSPRWTDDRGRITADTLRLVELAAEIQKRIAKDVVPRVEGVRSLAAAGNLIAAQAAWTALLDDKLHDQEESFRGPTWKALDLLVPHADRAAFGLTHPTRP